jgi:hypothetical protein
MEVCVIQRIYHSLATVLDVGVFGFAGAAIMSAISQSVPVIPYQTGLMAGMGAMMAGGGRLLVQWAQAERIRAEAEKIRAEAEVTRSYCDPVAWEHLEDIKCYNAEHCENRMPIKPMGVKA